MHKTMFFDILELNTRVWCNGNMAVSKTVDEGSIPFTRAKNAFLVQWIEHLTTDQEIGVRVA